MFIKYVYITVRSSAQSTDREGGVAEGGEGVGVAERVEGRGVAERGEGERVVDCKRDKVGVVEQVEG